MYYTGIDIGSSKVCAIVARVGTEGELKILGTGVVPSQGMLKGRIENINEVQTTVKAALEEAQKYIGRGVISGVYAGVSGVHISCANPKQVLENPGEVGDIANHRLQQLIQTSFSTADKGREILHIIPIGYQVDGLTGVRNPVGLQSNQVDVEVHMVTGDAATLKNNIKVVQAGKVPVHSLVLQALASAEATLTGDERELGSVLVDIGGGTTDMVIYREGNPWYSAVIPVGGNQLTRDLSVAMRTPWNLAEEIKVKWGCAMPDLVRVDEEVVLPSYQGQPRRVIQRRDLSEPLQARLVEMFKLVLLKVRQSGLRQFPTAGMVITGGCADLPGVKELAQKTLGGPVRIAYPTGIAGLPSQLRKPIFSTAVGLLLWGIKHQGEKRPYRNSERTLWGSKPFWSRNSTADAEDQKVAAQ
ncbi:MAG: cell division protein FtsA [SAR202 cluster bacterium Io17-Chloro-G9]|nr:MAG: cell division protein FtsA [SAR202 cluster bacterium Io17-Chloro-G9]